MRHDGTANNGGGTMLHQLINQFVANCRMANFSERSIQALSARLNEFSAYLKNLKFRSIKKVSYLDLVAFVADFGSPSVHVRKSRIWALRQFYHFLTVYGHVPENIATNLPYPKIEKTVPQFLTQDEYKQLLRHFSQKASDLAGLRNLVIIMLLGTLGLRTSTLTGLYIQDVDTHCGLLWVKEKGGRRRNMVLPSTLCKVLDRYLVMTGREDGPLLLSKRKRRISPRTLQDIFRSAADELGIDKRLHARLFRHSAATHLNKTSGIEVTRHVLGHHRRANTLKYAHLNPDKYAVYMKRHPYMKKETPCLH
jgi:site-specific recombinase XerD